jgi:hypothetical protein
MDGPTASIGSNAVVVIAGYVALSYRGKGLMFIFY